jgi:ketosteroid isomerase-like protein
LVATIDDLLAEHGLRDLQAAWADCITRKDMAELRHLFMDDAVLEIAGRGTFDGGDAVVGFLADVLGHWASIVHCVHTGRITLGSDRTTASGRWIISEFGTKDGNEVRFAGVYTDRYVVHDGVWRFAHRRFDGMFSRTAGDVTVRPFPGDLPAQIG